MLSVEDIQQKILVKLQDYPEIYARFMAGDPLIKAQLIAQATMLSLLSQEVERSELEPFLKTRDSTILADASNKGILPIATPCQCHVEFKNDSEKHLTIQAGRMLEDSYGRGWRLLENANIAPNSVTRVKVEQSIIKQMSYTATVTEPFQQIFVELDDDMYLANIYIYDQYDYQYKYKPNWMNIVPNEYAVNLKTDSRQRMIIEFGDSERFGRTLTSNTVVELDILQTYGEIDTNKLKEASLSEKLTADEEELILKFVDVIRLGVNPLTIDQLRLLSSYPNYDQNAVLLGDFEYRVRAKFANRVLYLSVWNESLQEQYYSADVRNINHLFVAVKAKNASEQSLLEQDIAQYIAQLDNLYLNRVRFVSVQEVPFNLNIRGNINAIHDLNTVKQQINSLLLSLYGRNTVASSYFLANGFNIQEISKKIRENIPAFQDRNSDYYITADDVALKPHQYVYLTNDSIHYALVVSQKQGLWSLT